MTTPRPRPDTIAPLRPARRPARRTALGVAVAATLLVGPSLLVGCSSDDGGDAADPTTSAAPTTAAAGATSAATGAGDAAAGAGAVATTPIDGPTTEDTVLRRIRRAARPDRPDGRPVVRAAVPVVGAPTATTAELLDGPLAESTELASGRLPLEPGEVVLAAELAEALGSPATVQLFVAGVEVRVVGVLASGADAGGATILAGPGTWDALDWATLRSSGVATAAEGSLRYPELDVETLQSRLADAGVTATVTVAG